jgi:hypothetical protein
MASAGPAARKFVASRIAFDIRQHRITMPTRMPSSLPASDADVITNAGECAEEDGWAVNELSSVAAATRRLQAEADAEVFNRVIESYAKHGRLDLTADTLKHMADAWTMPTARTMVTLINAYASVGLGAAAVDVGDMLERLMLAAYQMPLPCQLLFVPCLNWAMAGRRRACYGK